MEQPQGEFEQRPEAKPADEIPFSKPKASKTPWILCAILLIIVLGLGGFLLYDKVLSKKDDGDKGGSSQTADKPEEKPEEKKLTDEDITAKINEIFDDVKKEFTAEKLSVSDFEVTASSMIYSFKPGYATDADKAMTFGPAKLVLNTKKYTESSSVDMIAAHSIYKKVLTSKGFTESDALDGVEEVGVGEYKYFVDENGYACEYQVYGWSLSCGHKNWLSEEKEKLATGLLDAHKKVSAEVTYVGVNKDDIKDSKNSPYQTLLAYGMNGYEWFYRKGTDGEWVYVLGGNGIPLCKDFQKTEDMKKAFEGVETGCLENY